MMTIDNKADLISLLERHAFGRLSFDDQFFCGDNQPKRYGICDLDEEKLCHNVMPTSCSVLNCGFTSDSLLVFENHYNTAHRYSCSQCKKILPSPHLLDLHIQENHDSFFAVLATRKPSYSCFIEECKEKFLNAEERIDHGVKIHRLPKDYRFDQHHYGNKPKKGKQKKQKEKTGTESDAMDLEVPGPHSNKGSKFAFANSKQKTFAQYSGKKFTKDNNLSKKDSNVNIDEAMEEIKNSLPS